MIHSHCNKIVLLIFVLNSLQKFCKTNELTEFDDEDSLGYCLSELKISELLRLKKSIEKMNPKPKRNEEKEEIGNDEEKCSEDSVKPTALALVETQRSDHIEHHQPWIPEEKPTKLQTIFNISITALSFLSFGAYLLCLIVQAIKSKGTTYFHPVASTGNAFNGMKGIKIIRRSRRRIMHKPKETKLN